jgi:hypothetical protein
MTDRGTAPVDPLLSDAAAIAMARIISGAAIPAREGPDVDQVVRYVAGVLPEYASSALEEAALRDSGLRRSLVAVRHQLDQLESASWESARELVADGRVKPETMAAWTTLRNEQLSAAAARPPSATAGAAEILARAREGYREALAAITRWSNFAEQWKAALRQPGLAHARGAAAGSESVIDEATRLRVEIREAAIDSDGNLVAVGALLSDTPLNQDQLERPLYLGLSLGQTSWPLASAVPGQGEIRWEALGIGQLIGLRSARIPPESLHVHLDPPPWQPPAQSLILAAVEDADGNLSGRSAEILIVGPVVITSERLIVSVILPPSTRSGYEGHSLALYLAVSPRTSQCLGTWLVDEWPREGYSAGERRIEAHCPGSPDIWVEAPAAIRARLRPAAQ